jgi:hypothetical protein
MNARVEAGPMTIGVVGTVVTPVVSTQLQVVLCHPRSLTWTCFAPAPISINGHSLSAINPDFIKVGELTTSALA